MTVRLAVLISGNGSNLQAILDAIRMRVLDAQVVVVVSNRKAALGLERAAKAGVPTHYHPSNPIEMQGAAVRSMMLTLRRFSSSMHPIMSSLLDGCTFLAISFYVISPTG